MKEGIFLKARDELKLVFPNEEYKEQVMEYLQEYFDKGEFELNGDGGLDKSKNFDEWLQKIRNDLSEDTVENGRVPATMFLAVRKSDNKIVGNLQIRHNLNEKLLKSGGHIGDSIRPSERNKGYGTEMIRLALEECKKLGINRVLMVCYKENIASMKSIIKNGGVLENEIVLENGKIDQRYWISLKKRFADCVNKKPNVEEVQQSLKSFSEDDFQGDVYLNNFIKINKKFILENGVCIQDTDYKWLEFYDYNSKVRLTAMYNENNEIVQWYFDIARSLGKENGIPYEDDLYLDVVLTPEGKIILLDEDELQEAFEKYEMTKDEFDEAYKIAYDLMKKLEGKLEKVKNFTDKYLRIMLENKE